MRRDLARAETVERARRCAPIEAPARGAEQGGARILGDMPDDEKATDLELTLEGRVLTGAAKTEKGPIEFSFEC
jgi:hypothetical protein